MTRVAIKPRQIRSITKDPKLVDSRRKRLVETAIKLFISRGFDNVTVGDIATQARMSKGTMYNYIGSKEDLVFLIQRYTTDDYKKEFEAILKKTEGVAWTEVLREYIRAYLLTVDRMQDAYNFLNHVVASLSRDKREIVLAGLAERYDDFEAVLVKGNQAGEFHVQDPKLMGHNIVRLITAWANNRWHLRKFTSLDEYLEKQTDFIFGGLGITSEACRPQSRGD